LEVPVDDYVCYGLRMCVVFIRPIRVSQITIRYSRILCDIGASPRTRRNCLVYITV